MTKIDNGGPVFPFTPNQQMKLDDGTWDQNTDFGEPGMSLRALFAGLALQGLLAYSHVNPKVGNYHENCTVNQCAGHAIRLADALIAELRRDGPPCSE